jgi:hypothetical protein
VAVGKLAGDEFADASGAPPARSGSPWTIRYIAEVRDAPGPVLNGGIPHAAKASTLPKENISLAGPAGCPSTCSGDMKLGVPTTDPVAVSRVPATARDAEVDDPRPVHGGDLIE